VLFKHHFEEVTVICYQGNSLLNTSQLKDHYESQSFRIHIGLGSLRDSFSKEGLGNDHFVKSQRFLLLPLKRPYKGSFLVVSRPSSCESGHPLNRTLPTIGFSGETADCLYEAGYWRTGKKQATERYFYQIRNHC